MNYTKAILIGVILIILLAVITRIMKPKPPLEATNVPIRKDATVVAFGDSLVWGFGSSAGKDFVSLLSSRLGVPIINAGKNGDTTASAMQRLDADVLSKHPDIVIVLLGGNDALQQVPIDQTFANLSDIIDRIQGSGAKVLLLGVRGSLLDDVYRTRFDQLAKDKNVAYVPDILQGLFGHSDTMYDFIHPNDKGYAEIADRVEPVLRTLLRSGR